MKFTQEELNIAPLLGKIRVGMNVIGLPDLEYAKRKGVITYIDEGIDRWHEEGAVVEITVEFAQDKNHEKEVVFLHEYELLFLDEFMYKTIEGQLYCLECEKLKDRVLVESDTTEEWTWTGTEYEQTVSYGSSEKHFSDCRHELSDIEVSSPTRFLSRPLTETEICSRINPSGFLEETIQVNLKTLAELDAINIVEYLSERLIGSKELRHVDYGVVGLVPNETNVVFVQVLGDASLIVREYKKNVIEVKHVKEYEDGIEVSGTAKYNQKTNVVFDKQPSDGMDDAYELIREYIVLPNRKEKTIHYGNNISS